MEKVKIQEGKDLFYTSLINCDLIGVKKALDDLDFGVLNLEIRFMLDHLHYLVTPLEYLIMKFNSESKAKLIIPVLISYGFDVDLSEH